MPRPFVRLRRKDRWLRVVLRIDPLEDRTTPAVAHPQVVLAHPLPTFNSPRVADLSPSAAEEHQSPAIAQVPGATTRPYMAIDATAQIMASAAASPPKAKAIHPAAPPESKAVTPPVAPAAQKPPPSTTSPTTSTSADPTLLTVNLNPIDLNLLGLQVQTSQIQVTVSAQPGSGLLLGNLLTTAANLVNLQGVNTALDNVLNNVISLLNESGLSVSGVNSKSGPLSSTAAAATTPVLDLNVAPVHLSLLGVDVDTSPIHLTITAQSGKGLVLGNVLTDLANLFNPPLPQKLDINTINSKLQQLLSELNSQIPGVPSAPVTPVSPSSGQVLALTVPPINLNLLGLGLDTSQIQVNATAQSGNGELLGNVLQTLLNTLGATPSSIATLNNDLNAILAKVIGVLNATSLKLPANAVGTLSQALQTLSLPNLVNATGVATEPILDLAIASTNGSAPPVDVNLLGLNVTTSNITAQLTATTGNGQILGNLLYNVSHLLDPGGSLSLLGLLGELGL